MALLTEPARRPGAAVDVCGLLHALQMRFGVDLRDYDRETVARRILRGMDCGGPGASAVPAEAAGGCLRALARLLQWAAPSFTEMFRDPTFFRRFRRKVVPALKTMPCCKIWHAGCATGEEAYSMAVLLKEEALYGRTRIYATDINPHVLEIARGGIYPLCGMRRNSRNYHLAGGHNSLADYYTAGQDAILMKPELRANMVFASHDLFRNAGFTDVQAVICRNVMIYYGPAIRTRALKKLQNGLEVGGFLCSEPGLSPMLNRHGAEYAVVDDTAGIYRRLR